MNKIFRKSLAVAFIGIISVPMALIAGSFIPRRWFDQAQTDRIQTGCQYRVCVVQFDIHTNILVPVYTNSFDWRNYLPLPLQPQQYLGFGWGDRDWYMNPPSAIGDVLSRGWRAMLFSESSAVGIQAYDRPPTENIKCVGVSQAQYLQLMEFLNGSLRRDPQGNTIALSNHPPTQTNYFEAIGQYSALHNSNHWTADGLAAAQINTPLWAGFSFGVMRQIEANCPPTQAAIACDWQLG